MPQKTIEGEFKIDPEYDEIKGFHAEIEHTREYLEKLLSEVDKIEDTTLQLIGMFSLIDMLAQEQANYPPNFKNAFCQFVLKHQKQCNYLECVEPITLYYRVEDIIDEVEPLPGFPSEKEVSIENLGYCYAEPVSSMLSTGKAKEILDYIEQKVNPEFAAKMAKEHRLISLLYRMRSKAVHEMSGLGENMRFHPELKPKEPYYRDVGRSYVENGNWVSDDVVELVIPNVFIRNILTDCIDGYLADCMEKKRDPFCNNNISRKYILSWYDK